MRSNNFKRDNHYVPRGYLKRWASSDGKLWSYRVLVSRSEVPLWKRVSTRGIGYHEHLYTRIVASGECDELERWLDVEFESPAEEAIQKVVSDRRLSPGDWRALARFFAAQDVRTPARLVENLGRWSQSLPETMQEALQRSVARLEEISAEERAVQGSEVLRDESIPFRVGIGKNSDADCGWIEVETVAGRGLWIWSIQYLLSRSAGLRALERHRWTILTPPDEMTWITSDDPVLKLNFNTPQKYDFGGGWGSPGTYLMLPLGPRHLLFTQVGCRVPPRGSQMDRAKALFIRKLLAEHAHRHVFASSPDKSVPQVRPRIVDTAAFIHESSQWKSWHAEQSQAERQLMGWVNPNSNTSTSAT
ncbi:DUF4238 domain-containing protein [Cyanobium sp. N.Huapi 1H5]|uniref:DUF4238 domain-containing protein n=1 Tax=Cyanobium sp. N.Huapi 1H5 TaxID=2823719 RepID=UPI0020CC45DC|nr:DUF4238 domain-containing protein [Cyanobium sp. N.Huapi 1H5]MCP9837549.1 DUF4238 domain-containing protein [Cyanobium sp. N.Huapi 1H5]